jgi:hypothetical protein
LGEQLVTQDAHQDRSWTGLAKDMIGAIDDVDTTPLAQPFDRRSDLDPQKINAGLAARKCKYHPYPSRRDFLELPSRVAWQAPTEIARPIA